MNTAPAPVAAASVPASALPLMLHVVAGWPNPDAGLALAARLVALRPSWLEVQLPFSHPTADGPLISAANAEALAAGLASAEACFGWLRALRAAHPQEPLMLMTYANRALGLGLARLAGLCAELSVSHIIIPDLPFDAPEAAEWRALAPGTRLVPVLAANVAPARLVAALALAPDFVYVMADFATTGGAFRLREGVAALCAQVRGAGARVGLGFGISGGEAVRAALAVADVAIVGSALIAAEREGRLDALLAELAEAAASTSP